MKKVLLATTAAVLSAGVAYADVAVTGSARMGLNYNKPSGGAARTTLEKRVSIDITGTTESSSGITFGAAIRLRSEDGLAGGTVAAGARVFMQTNGFELAMGNIHGAIENMDIWNNVGLTGLGFSGLVTNVVGADLARGTGADGGYWGWDSYSSSGNGAEGIEVNYTAGAFAGHLSYSDGTVGTGLNTTGSGIKRAAASGSYTFNDWTVGLGVQKSNLAAEDKTVLTVGGKIGDYGVRFGYADNNGIKKMALDGSATFGATTVSAFVAKEDTTGTDTIFGLGVAYDLGGATLAGGIERDEIGTTRADLGVSFSF